MGESDGEDEDEGETFEKGGEDGLVYVLGLLPHPEHRHLNMKFLFSKSMRKNNINK